MSAQNGSAGAEDTDINLLPPAGAAAEEKGKGKAYVSDLKDLSMDEEDDSSEEETGAEDNATGALEEEDEDNMEEIDIDNIITDGRRTRGKTIDFAEAAKEAGEDLDDDDEDGDDDFEVKDDEDAMQEFGSSRNQRDALFDNYSGDKYRTHSTSPARAGGYGLGATGASGAGGTNAYRPATPNSRGQYSDAVLSELESQNDGELEGMSAKVKMLKDITVAIGDEIRDSSALADKMNDSFDNTRVRLRGTMNRMLRMAERTGVGWKAWVGFFVAVCLVFWYVWLF